MLSGLVLSVLVGAGVYPTCPGTGSGLWVAPGPSETGLPTNLSLWFRGTNLPGASPDALGVRLVDAADEREIPLTSEVLMEWLPRADRGAAEVLYRFTPRAPLDLGRAYAVSWRGVSSLSEGHIFVVGAPPLLEPPPPPGPTSITSPELLECGAHRSVVVSASNAARFLVATIGGELRGLGPDGSVAAYLDGAPGDTVVGEVVAMDIAGNRSASVAFSATTPRIAVPQDPPEVGGCSTLGGEGVAALVALAVLAGARRRRGPRPGSAQTPRAFCRRAAMYSRVNTAPFS